MVPIHLPEDKPAEAILAEEAAILEAEGPYHVAGNYYASQGDATKQRRWEAEKRVREAARQQRVACAFCNNWIEQGIEPVAIAGRLCHPHCAEEFADWMESKPEENDARWQSVTDATVVIFDGEETTWGELMVQDRKTCHWTKDGLVGGYPLDY